MNGVLERIDQWMAIQKLLQNSWRSHFAASLTNSFSPTLPSLQGVEIVTGPEVP